MDVAVVEGEVGHARKLAGGGIEEFFLDSGCALELRDVLVTGLQHGAVGWLGPVEVVGEAIGILVEIDNGLGVVIADDTGEEGRAEQGCALGGVGLIGVVYGPEVGLVFGDAAAAIDDVAGNEDIVGLLLGGMEGDFALGLGVGGAIAEDDEVRGLVCGLAGDGGGFEDDFAVCRDTVGEGFAGLEFREGGGVDAMGIGAGEIDAADLFGAGLEPGVGGFVFDGEGDVFVMAHPHQLERILGGAVAELEIGLFKEVGVFGKKREGEGKKEQDLHWYLFILCK